MPKICFIGNSHLAAVKLAWDDVGERYPNVSIDMFGGRGVPGLKDALLSDGSIVAGTEVLRGQFEWTGGMPAIRLADYSAFYLIGAGITSFVVFDLYPDFHFHELNGRQGRLISEPCFRQAARAVLNDKPGIHVMRLIRRGTGAPIFICPNPLPSDACLSDARSAVSHRLAAENGDAERLMTMFAGLCDEIAEETDARLVAQPEETRSGIAFTRSQYSEGSIRLTRGLDLAHPKRDYRHMNRRYGAAVLAALFADDFDAAG